MSSSSSGPRIVIVPKKKKKKSTIVTAASLSSSSSSSMIPTKGRAVGILGGGGGADGGGGGPPSPTAVIACPGGGGGGVGVAAATTTTDVRRRPGGGRISGSRPGGGVVLIRPFSRPPVLPPDFYESSLDSLRRALDGILLAVGGTTANSDIGGGGGGGGGSGRNPQPLLLPSREELYRSVEDLRVHGHGTRLYLDVARMMDGAAMGAIRRLAATTTPSSSSSSGDDVVAGGEGEGSGIVGRAIDAFVDPASGLVGYDPSRLAFDPNALLRRARRELRSSYLERYLTYVRSIFLVLDGAYAFRSDVVLEEIGCDDARRRRGRTTIAASSSSSSTSWVPTAPDGRVIERSAASGGSGSDSRIWGLRDVGIACLRRHATTSPPGYLPVLTALIVATARAVLSEYDRDGDGGDASSPFPAASSSSSSSSSSAFDARPLARDCVRTIIDLGSISSLLEELVVIASCRFGTEGESWKVALREGGRTASEFLVYVERRLRRGVSLADYYLPGSGGVDGVAALRGLSRLGRLSGAMSPPSSSGAKSSGDDNVVWSPADDSYRRIFPAIIERRLLGPNLSIPGAGVLESRHLFPILDDDAGGVGGDMAWKSSQPGLGSGSKTYENARRLYGLCWRMTASSAFPGSDPTPPSSASALDLLRVAFGKYGRIRGHEIVQQGLPKLSPDGTPIANNNVNLKDMEKRVIPDLLAFRKHLYSLHAVAFRGEESFGAAVRSILDDVLNGSASGSSLLDDGDSEGGRRTAELLAKHVDVRFKDAKASAGLLGGGSVIDAAITADVNESFQNEIFVLFRHLHSKDVFEAFYKRELAKRLLTGRAVSTDMEWSFLTKLKAECGTSYTSKMEGMFADMELSRDIMGSYAAYSAGSAAATPAAAGDGKMVDMDVQLLTTGFWPVYPQYSNIILPPELLALRTKFENYYNIKYQGRRITWQYSLGNCIVKASFPKSIGPKELIVNVCQSLVLLCFKHCDGLDGLGFTLDEIMKKTGIDDRPELERVLQSLSMGRDGTRVLRKVDYDSPTQPISPSSKSPISNNKDVDSPQKAKKQRVRRNVGPYDRFLFNASFTSNQRRIRITNITMKETSEERTKTHAAVSKDRLYFIDAACVRIMKARKTIDHRDLIGEVMSQLKFPASSADIKKRIESLIEREYMERVEGDRSKYKYLA